MCSSLRGLLVGMAARRRATAGASPGVDRVQRFRHGDQPFALRIVAAIPAQPLQPVERSPPAPIIRRPRQKLRGAAIVAMRLEIEERAADIAHGNAASGAEDIDPDHGVASRRQVPRTGEPHRHARFRLQCGKGEVLDVPAGWIESLSARFEMREQHATAGQSSSQSARSTRCTPRSIRQPPPESARSRNHGLSGP